MKKRLLKAFCTILLIAGFCHPAIAAEFIDGVEQTDGAGGTGDFKADGSVPMTGNFNAGSNDLTNVKDMEMIGAGSQISGVHTVKYANVENTATLTGSTTNRWRVYFGLGAAIDGWIEGYGTAFGVTTNQGVIAIKPGNSVNGGHIKFYNAAGALHGQLNRDGTWDYQGSTLSNIVFGADVTGLPWTNVTHGKQMGNIYYVTNRTDEGIMGAAAVVGPSTGEVWISETYILDGVVDITAYPGMKIRGIGDAILDASAWTATQDLVRIGTSTKIENFTIIGNKGGGTAFDNVEVTGQFAILRDINSFDADDDGFTFDAIRATLINCRADNCGGVGIELDQRHTTLKGCRVTDSRGQCGSNGIEINGSSDFSTIEGCYVENVAETGIRLIEDNVTLIGCMVEDCDVDNYFISGADLIIKGNRSKTPAGDGFDVDDMDSSVFSGNITTGGGAGDAAFKFRGGCVENIISDNVAGSGPDIGFYCDNMDECLFTDNSADGHTTAFDFDASSTGNKITDLHPTDATTDYSFGSYDQLALPISVGAGSYLDGADEQNLTASYQVFTNAFTTNSAAVTATLTNFTILKAGTYYVSFSISAALGNAESMEAAVHLNNVEQHHIEAQGSTPATNQDRINVANGGRLVCAVGDSIDLRVKSLDAAADFDPDKCGFSIHEIK